MVKTDARWRQIAVLVATLAGVLLTARLGLWQLDRAAQKRRDMELDLRYALANNEFELYYQPLVDVSENRIVAFDVRLRGR